MNSKNKLVRDVFVILSNDKLFIKRLEKSLKNIMHDGKIDYNDIPELIYIITDAYNQLSKFELTYEELPILIKLIYNFLIQKYNFIPDDKKPEFEKLVDSALKLVMMQPKIKAAVSNCLNKFSSCCFKSSSSNVLVSIPKSPIIISMDEESKKETKEELKEETKEELKEETKEETKEELKEETKEETKEEKIVI